MTTRLARISVVIPAFNAEATIAHAISSALDQTYPAHEVVVVDDGSVDATSSVIADVGDEIRSVRTENRGVSHARNIGFRMSEGKFIAFLDADDRWEPDKLAIQMAALAADEAATMSTTGARAVDFSGRTLAFTPAYIGDDACLDLLLNSMIAGPISSAIIERSELERLGGFDTRFSQCADWDLFLRVARSGRMAVVADPLVVRLSSQRQMSSNISLLERDTFAVLDAFFDDVASRRYADVKNRIYSNHWLIVSGSYLHAGKPLAAARCLAKGVRREPGNAVRVLKAPVRWTGRLQSRLDDRKAART